MPAIVRDLMRLCWLNDPIARPEMNAAVILLEDLILHDQKIKDLVDENIKEIIEKEKFERSLRSLFEQLALSKSEKSISSSSANSASTLYHGEDEYSIYDDFDGCYG